MECCACPREPGAGLVPLAGSWKPPGICFPARELFLLGFGLLWSLHPEIKPFVGRGRVLSIPGSRPSPRIQPHLLSPSFIAASSASGHGEATVPRTGARCRGEPEPAGFGSVWRGGGGGSSAGVLPRRRWVTIAPGAAARPGHGAQPRGGRPVLAAS